VSRWRASKTPEDYAIQPEAQSIPEGKTPAPKQDPILALQRAVGNQTVQKMLPRSEGEPIAAGERTELEAAFGQDLSEVRIHRDEAAGDLTAEAGANALTSGRDIYFAPGAYGSATLAHEVSHVVQQEQSTSVLPGEDASLEHQANLASSAVMSGQAPQISGVVSAPAMQRQPAPGAQSSPLKLLPSDSITLDSFDIDKFVISGSNQQKLDKFAARLKATLASAPDSIVTIVGFADAPGTEPHNLALGQQRADAVLSYLVAKGVPENQLHATSLGEAAPLVASKGYEAKNRRVEINVVERTFFKPPPVTIPPAPVASPPAATPKLPDLKINPERHEPSPSEELQEKFRRVDQAVREAEAAEKANRGTSAADLAGRALRNAAKKLGLPKWVQDRAESLGQDLPSKGAQAVVDQIASDKSLDSNTQNALKALVDALMRTKVK
jgi:outer membrane protein OmpA-like peptidoglycan-associated protein